MDISTKIGDHKFNFRVSAVIRRGEEILVHHGIGIDHVTLPGGRVADGENTFEALQREIKEEMGYETKLIKPIAFTENFFYENDQNYHELLMTYEVEFKEKKVYKQEKIEAIEPHKKGILEFLWVNQKKLEEKNFLPKNLIPIIIKETEFTHTINDDRKNKGEKNEN